MESNEYDRKIQEMLSTDTYRELTGDPNATQEVKKGWFLRGFVERRKSAVIFVTD